MKNQGTLARAFSLDGVALHSGRQVRVRVLPAPAEHGVRFVRVDLPRPVPIPARVDSVVDTLLATTLGRAGQRVSTVEHFLAAMSVAGVDNARVEVDGPEMPALDGSSLLWFQAIQRAGLVSCAAVRPYLVVLQEVHVADGLRQATLSPAPRLEIAATVEFDHPLLRRSTLDMVIDPRTFAAELAWARTFGFQREVEQLRAQGFARGGSLDNALVFSPDGVLNSGGLRGPDEAVRHKIIDAVGDLSLLGCPVRARLEAVRPGHSLHLELLRALLERPQAWRMVREGTAAH